GPSAPAIPAAQLLRHRAHVAAAPIPAGPRPQLEVQVATGGVARLAHAPDHLPGAHALARAHLGAAAQVHVHILRVRARAGDDDVVARGRALVGAVAHLARARRDELGAAAREDVLPAVTAP